MNSNKRAHLDTLDVAVISRLSRGEWPSDIALAEQMTVMSIYQRIRKCERLLDVQLYKPHRGPTDTCRRMGPLAEIVLLKAAEMKLLGVAND